MSIKEQIQAQIKQKIKEQMATKVAANKPKEEPKSAGGFLGNLGKDITSLAKGIAGMGYQAVTHPVESAKSVAATGGEVIKNLPKAASELTGQMAGMVTHPIKSTQEAVSAYNTLKNVPYADQKKVFGNITNKLLQEQETGKRNAGLLGAGLLESTIEEITHPTEYAYEKPFSFALDVLSAGKASGVNKATASVAKSVVEKVPVLDKALATSSTAIKNAMREVFTPNAKLINSGYEDLAKDLTKTKSEIFKTQKNIVDDTATKFYREFELTKKEQEEFFDTIDNLRRDTSGVKATSANPKIQKAINWWLDEEVPELRKTSGLADESAITNYMHHFFPEKFNKSEVMLNKPLQYAKKGYLKKSKDVEGFTKDPVVSISAIKSKTAIDSLKDGFIKRTIENHSVKLEDLSKQIASEGVDVAELEKTGKLTNYIKNRFDLEEYKPKGNLRFYNTDNGIGVSKNVETHLMPKVIVEELNNFVNPKNKTALDQLFKLPDWFNRNWKPLATAARPRYHTRNIVGNLYNSIVIGGMNPKRIPQALFYQVKGYMSEAIKNNTLQGKVYKIFFKDGIPQPEIMKLAIDNDVIGRGFFGADLNDLATAAEKGEDIMKVLGQLSGKTPKAGVYKIPVLKQYLVISQKVGEFLEDNARLAMFQEGIKKYGGDIDMAKNYVDEHLFDYMTGLGEGDKILKRFIPFWSWTRFNVPLQIKSLIDNPERHMILKKVTDPLVKASEMQDEGYQYLSDKQKAEGYMKVGETEKSGKKYDKYIKTASVIPQSDIVRVINILLNGEMEDIGLSPIKQIWEYALKNPTEVLDYWNQPLEKFQGEQKKFLGQSVSGQQKALLSTIPVITEANTAMGGSYNEDEKPLQEDRIEQVLSPFGLSLQNKKDNQFYRELDEQRKLTGSWTAGLESLYKNNLEKDLKYKGSEKQYSKNVDLLENELKKTGLTDIEITKIKIKAVKALIKDTVQEGINKAK